MHLPNFMCMLSKNNFTIKTNKIKQRLQRLNKL